MIKETPLASALTNYICAKNNDTIALRKRLKVHLKALENKLSPRFLKAVKKTEQVAKEVVSNLN